LYCIVTSRKHPAEREKETPREEEREVRDVLAVPLLSLK
jgi:hypothetical protein